MANPYKYTVYKTSETSEIVSEGFTIVNTSTDGLLAIVDKKSTGNPTVTSAPTKPSYIVESIPTWPNMSHAQAEAVIAYEATSNGASDGWYYDNRS